jgi:hypothetical protein
VDRGPLAPPQLAADVHVVTAETEDLGPTQHALLPAEQPRKGGLVKA